MAASLDGDWAAYFVKLLIIPNENQPLLSIDYFIRDERSYNFILRVSVGFHL